MGYVTDSIQFRTGYETPLSHFASVFNYVRDVILATGMEQVSLEDWPDQMGDVITGVATGNDVSLDDLDISAGYNRVGSWVFKHPELDMYVNMEVGLIAQTVVPHIVRLPRFLFTCGQELDIGNSGFIGSTVQSIPVRVWYASTNVSNNATAYSLERHPANDYILRAYCGSAGFWIYADGGTFPSTTGLTHALPGLPRLSMLCATFLVTSGSSYRVSLGSVNQVVGSSGTLAGIGIGSIGPDVVGVVPSTYFAGTWREQIPGGLGTLDAPQILSTDKGIRVAQCQLYGAGAPIPLPLAMVQASFEEVPFRLDLDGSGERTWIPVPAYQAVQFFVDAAPPANLQNHCIYALPASDD